jgi:L-malate glycosyltransferase
MARVLYVSQGYCTHDRRFLERLANAHEMWFLPCEKASVQRDLLLPEGDIQSLRPLSGCKLSPGTNSWSAAAERFRKIIQEVSPDLVHAGPIPLGGYLTALAGFHPALMMSWGSDVLAFPDTSASAKTIVQFSLRHCDMAIADCEAVGERVVELGGFATERIVTLPWGVDLAVFRPKRSSLGIRERLGWCDCKVIISTRALELTHSPFVFLNAIKRVFAEHHDARALILGDGSLRHKVESFIQVNGMRDRVHLASQVPEPALGDYFAEADLYVSATECDGSSISLLQAMACGLAPIVADGFGNNEWIRNGENGWLYRAGDDQVLAQAIVRALEDDDARRIAGEANIQIARARADWERNFPRVLAAYEQLLNERHGAEMRNHAQLQNR